MEKSHVPIHLASKSRNIDQFLLGAGLRFVEFKGTEFAEISFYKYSLVVIRQQVILERNLAAMDSLQGETIERKLASLSIGEASFDETILLITLS